jgi:hypothetical protein
MAETIIARRVKGKTNQKLNLSMERRVYLAGYAGYEFDAIANNLRQAFGKIAAQSQCESFDEKVIVSAMLARMKLLADALMDVGEVEDDCTQDAIQIESRFALCPERRMRESRAAN